MRDVCSLSIICHLLSGVRANWKRFKLSFRKHDTVICPHLFSRRPMFSPPGINTPNCWHLHHRWLWSEKSCAVIHNIILSFQTLGSLEECLESANCASSFSKGSLICIIQSARQLFVYRPEDTEQGRHVGCDGWGKKFKSLFTPQGLWAVQPSQNSNASWKLTWATKQTGNDLCCDIAIKWRNWSEESTNRMTGH